MTLCICHVCTCLYHGSLRKQRHCPQCISAKSTNHSLIHSIVKGNKLYMVICFLHFRRQFALLYQLSLCVGRSLQYYKVNGTPEHPHLHALPSLYFSWYSMALLPLEPSGFAPPLPLVQSAFLSLVVAAPQLC